MLLIITMINNDAIKPLSTNQYTQSPPIEINLRIFVASDNPRTSPYPHQPIPIPYSLPIPMPIMSQPIVPTYPLHQPPHFYHPTTPQPFTQRPLSPAPRFYNPSNPKQIPKNNNQPISITKIPPKQKQPQKQKQTSYPPRIEPLIIKCPICQIQITRENRKQHEEYHRIRLKKCITIPVVRPRSNQQLQLYTRQELIDVVLKTQQKMQQMTKIKSTPQNMIHQPVGQSQKMKQIRPQNNEPHLKQPSPNFLGTTFRPLSTDIPLSLPLTQSQSQSIPHKPVTSPNISKINLQNQSDCFSDVDILEIPLEDSDKRKKIIDEASGKGLSESVYYKIGGVDYGGSGDCLESQYGKKKRLPSNKMAFDIYTTIK